MMRKIDGHRIIFKTNSITKLIPPSPTNNIPIPTPASFANTIRSSMIKMKQPRKLV